MESLDSLGRRDSSPLPKPLPVRDDHLIPTQRTASPPPASARGLAVPTRLQYATSNSGPAGIRHHDETDSIGSVPSRPRTGRHPGSPRRPPSRVACSLSFLSCGNLRSFQKLSGFLGLGNLAKDSFFTSVLHSLASIGCVGWIPLQSIQFLQFNFYQPNALQSEGDWRALEGDETQSKGNGRGRRRELQLSNRVSHPRHPQEVRHLMLQPTLGTW